MRPVGAFAASPGPYGTFDQGGDLFQWTDSLAGQGRVNRGSSYEVPAPAMVASDRQGTFPSLTEYDIGFRVAAVPEPGTITLLVFGAVGLLFARRQSSRRKRRATARGINIV